MTTTEWGEGLVLRYGSFYGPGTAISLAPDAQTAAPIRKRELSWTPRFASWRQGFAQGLG